MSGKNIAKKMKKSEIKTLFLGHRLQLPHAPPARQSASIGRCRQIYAEMRIAAVKLLNKKESNKSLA
ncbi:hypothetical protein [Kosakonia arachidis]|uniref:hypothetical protein n=1 Tax=Kosakonia arachidis TaxID=551989 RepID=UPI000B7EEBE0|nr:hypothetical protein [Kosakonia arachidis]